MLVAHTHTHTHSSRTPCYTNSPPHARKGPTAVQHTEGSCRTTVTKPAQKGPRWLQTPYPPHHSHTSQIVLGPLTPSARGLDNAATTHQQRLAKYLYLYT